PLVDLRRRQSDAVVLDHRLEHVVDEPLDRSALDLSAIDRPRTRAQHGMTHPRDLQNRHAIRLYIWRFGRLMIGSTGWPSPGFTPRRARVSPGSARAAAGRSRAAGCSLANPSGWSAPAADSSPTPIPSLRAARSFASRRRGWSWSAGPSILATGNWC